MNTSQLRHSSLGCDGRNVPLLLLCALVLIVLLPGCVKDDLLTSPAPAPLDPPRTTEPAVRAARDALGDVDRQASAVHIKAPAELKADSQKLVDLVKLAVRKFAVMIGVIDAYETGTNAITKKYNALVTENAKFRAELAEARKALEEAEAKRQASTAWWFIVAGGVIFAAGVAVTLKLDADAGILAVVFGLVLLLLGLALKFLAANPWVLWIGAVVAAAGACYMVWRSGLLGRARTALDRVVLSVEQYEPESAVKNPAGLKSAILGNTPGDGGAVNAEVKAAKGRQGL